ncbi:unnamed protein product [Sympodiomycopsis kandeliae]
MSDTITATKRQLTIKTGVVKRLTKEETLYIKEVSDHTAKLQKMEAEEKDEWTIKNQRKVIADCAQMIPDTRKRLANAVDELSHYLEGVEGEELQNSTEVTAAKQALQAAQEQQQQQQS